MFLSNKHNETIIVDIGGSLFTHSLTLLFCPERCWSCSLPWVAQSFWLSYVVNEEVFWNFIIRKLLWAANDLMREPKESLCGL